MYGNLSRAIAYTNSYRNIHLYYYSSCFYKSCQKFEILYKNLHTTRFKGVIYKCRHYFWNLHITHSFSNSRWGQTGCCQTFDSFWGVLGSTFGDSWCSRFLFFCCSKENVCQKNSSNEKFPRFYAFSFDEIRSGWSLGSIQIRCWSTDAWWNWFV